MANNPQEIGDRITTVINAWQKAIDDGAIPADKKFKGMTLADFKAKVQPSLNARAELTKLDLATTNWIDKRNDADGDSLAAIQDVKAGIVGDADFGDDSGLYEQMGYIRKSERASGLTRNQKQSASAAAK